MKRSVTIISSVFHPEPIMSARTSTDLAHMLASNGHRVRVITAFPNRPAGMLYQGYQQKPWAREPALHGYDILRIFSFFSSQSSLLSRFLENFSFGISSFLALLFLEKPDVVYANTWPIFAQGLLVLECKLRRIPLVLSIQDLYPESLSIQKRGIEKTSWLYRLLFRLDAWMARHCSGLVMISEKFKDTYVHDRGIAESKITVIPNWTNDVQQVSHVSAAQVRKRHNIPEDALLVVYGGNIGVAAGVEVLIDGFQYLAPKDNIFLLIAGAGSSLSNCRELIQRYRLECVKIHSPWDALETFAVLNSADLCILPTQGEQSLVSVPSKLLTYMAAGRCVFALASPSSETARIVQDAQCGWVTSENSPAALANHIREILRLPLEEREKRGRAGHDYWLENFSRSKNLPKLVNLLIQHGESGEQSLCNATS